jgi:hypothetical protein
MNQNESKTKSQNKTTSELMEAKIKPLLKVFANINYSNKHT